jgi:DNA-binding NtrC family response regulator
LHILPTIASSLEFLRDNAVNLLILSLNIADSTGLSGLRQLHAAYPVMQILVVTEHLNGELAQAVEDVGPGISFLSKNHIEEATFGLYVRALILASNSDSHSSQGRPITILPLPGHPVAQGMYGQKNLIQQVFGSLWNLSIFALTCIGLLVVYFFLSTTTVSQHKQQTEILKQILHHIEKGRALY